MSSCLVNSQIWRFQAKLWHLYHVQLVASDTDVFSNIILLHGSHTVDSWISICILNIELFRIPRLLMYIHVITEVLFITSVLVICIYQWYLCCNFLLYYLIAFHGFITQNKGCLSYGVASDFTYFLIYQYQSPHLFHYITTHMKQSRSWPFYPYLDYMDC